MTSPTRGRNQFSRWSRALALLQRAAGALPTSVRESALIRVRHLPGIAGLGLRYVLLGSLSASCGKNVAIYPGAYILHPQGLQVADNVSIHPMTYIDATGGINIGNDVSIAHGATIMSTKHSFESSQRPIKDQPVTRHTTTIEDNVWIAAKASILAGLRIGSGSIIAAGAVVTRDVAPQTIVGGVPASKIGYRPLGDH